MSRKKRSTVPLINLDIYEQRKVVRDALFDHLGAMLVPSYNSEDCNTFYIDGLKGRFNRKIYVEFESTQPGWDERVKARHLTVIVRAPIDLWKTDSTRKIMRVGKSKFYKSSAWARFRSYPTKNKLFSVKKVVDLVMLFIKEAELQQQESIALQQKKDAKRFYTDQFMYNCGIVGATGEMEYSNIQRNKKEHNVFIDTKITAQMMLANDEKPSPESRIDVNMSINLYGKNRERIAEILKSIVATGVFDEQEEKENVTVNA
jgi:hypothetical protein